MPNRWNIFLLFNDLQFTQVLILCKRLYLISNVFEVRLTLHILYPHPLCIALGGWKKKSINGNSKQQSNHILSCCLHCNLLICLWTLYIILLCDVVVQSDYSSSIFSSDYIWFAVVVVVVQRRCASVSYDIRNKTERNKAWVKEDKGRIRDNWISRRKLKDITRPTSVYTPWLKEHFLFIFVYLHTNFLLFLSFQLQTNW